MLNSLSRRIAAGALVTAAALITTMPASAQQAAGSTATPPQTTGQQRPARPALFTAEERAQFRQRMQAAKTSEERAKLRDEMHKTTELRAKEKGIELPKRPMRGPQHDGKGGPRGAGDAAGKDGSAPATTPKP